MARIRYVQDPTFEQKIMLDPAMAEFLGELANEVARSAETKAPHRTGILAGSIEGTVVHDGLNVVGRVESDDWKTLLVEYGTRRTHAHPFLWPAVYETIPGAAVSRGGS